MVAAETYGVVGVGSSDGDGEVAVYRPVSQDLHIFKHWPPELR